MRIAFIILVGWYPKRSVRARRRKNSLAVRINRISKNLQLAIEEVLLERGPIEPPDAQSTGRKLWDSKRRR